MDEQQVRFLIDEAINNHKHTGLDSMSLFEKQPTISSPSGGGTIDTQARTAINSIITTLQKLKLTK